MDVLSDGYHTSVEMQTSMSPTTLTWLVIFTVVLSVAILIGWIRVRYYE